MTVMAETLFRVQDKLFLAVADMQLCADPMVRRVHSFLQMQSYDQVQMIFSIAL